MSKIRNELENQVLYCKLTAPEWKKIRGNFPKKMLRLCLRSKEHANELKSWLRLESAK